jgi:hypothetical protein
MSSSALEAGLVVGQVRRPGVGGTAPAPPVRCDPETGEDRQPVDSALAIPSLPNLRDIGGTVVDGGGRVRTGLLFRSTALDGLDDAGLRTLGGSGIRTVFDLRTDDERRARPDRLPADAVAVPLDMLRDALVDLD